MHTTFAVPLVLSSCLTGLIGAFIPFPARYKNNPNAAIYTGSFAGMCSIDLIGSYWELAIISFIGAGLFIFTINHLHGFGGKLGSVAFVSVGIYMLAKGIVL
ncbi:hypothetical protein [Pseudoalteromonas sp. MMG010]|uniref:hypothetical protein n=1 Tax=Pseudoalteromonas sp. MMG010 TaxID=2822685 RepID=UPI001FFDC84C|nr:hypothetical protein [Pseudoalteromonas sp. MMG010]